MFPAERRREIEKFVNDKGTCSITELSQKFNVSEMTIHRDLHTLESMGALRKIRGGALASPISLVPTEYQKRVGSYQEEKDIVGRQAASFVRDGETILIGPGTTCRAMARFLTGFQNLTVYTNGPAVISELSQIPGVDVYCLGGYLRKNSMALIGPETEKALGLLRPDKTFFGAHGFTLELGVTDPFPFDASFKRKMVEVSQEVYLLITPDKFGNVAQHVSVPTEAIDIIILHKDTPENYLAAIRESEIRSIIAG